MDANGSNNWRPKGLVFKTRVLPLLLTIAVAASTLLAGGGMVQAQGNSRNFPQTGYTVSGLFLNYWDQNGALPQQGYPLTDEFKQQSQTDGKTYTMQCFERAVFENHPENVGTPSEVLLSLLGNFYYKQNYQFNAPAGQHASTDNPRFFSQTNHTLGGIFRAYWEQNGGLAQQGFPITDEFMEKSALDGKTYLVQYFERAVFEYHPEQADPQYKVLLSQLGKFLCPATAKPTPSPTPNPNFDPNKYYHLTTQFRGDGLCLDTADTTTTSSLAALHPCSNVIGELWRITSAGGGNWQLTTQYLGPTKCLDTYSGAQLGGYANLAGCGNFTGQHWTIKPAAGQAGYYTMTNGFGGPSKCLDILNGGQYNNYASLNTCGNFTGQWWKFTEVK